MGLDVTAYSGLKKLDVVFDESGEPLDKKTFEPIENYFKVRANTDFPGREEGLEDRAIYSYETYGGHFSMGYGSYSGWREKLAELAGYPKYPHEKYGRFENLHTASCWNGAAGPFSELINFSDCEGVIGPFVAKKLAKDFADHDAHMKLNMSDIYYKKYCDMRECMEIASNNGAVSFH